MTIIITVATQNSKVSKIPKPPLSNLCSVQYLTLMETSKIVIEYMNKSTVSKTELKIRMTIFEQTYESGHTNLSGSLETR